VIEDGVAVNALITGEAELFGRLLPAVGLPAQSAGNVPVSTPPETCTVARGDDHVAGRVKTLPDGKFIVAVQVFETGP
jgi:hypothetical protein